MRTKAQAARRQRGQSVVELLVTIFAFFTIAFMYVQVSLGFAVANYIQYATFMGARALLSGHATEQLQKSAATGVVAQMLTKEGGVDRFKSIAEGTGGGTVNGLFVGRSSRVELGTAKARRTAWEQGVTYKFKMRMYMVPLVKGAKRGDAAKLQLTSESWLGRDPSEEECVKQLQQRASEQSAGQTYLYDNGC